MASAGGLSLAWLAPGALSMITRHLSISALIRLVILSGNLKLRRQCCNLGGVTDAHVDNESALTLLMRTTTSFLSRFTHLQRVFVWCDPLSRARMRAPRFTHNLPRNLRELSIESTDAFDMLLRDVMPSDPPFLQALSTLHSNAVPISLKDTFQACNH